MDDHQQLAIFRREIVQPLRDLQLQGYCRILEHVGSYRGYRFVDRVQIIELFTDAEE